MERREGEGEREGREAGEQKKERERRLSEPSASAKSYTKQVVKDEKKDSAVAFAADITIDYGGKKNCQSTSWLSNFLSLSCLFISFRL